MSVSITSCCVSVLNHYQQASYHLQHCSKVAPAVCTSKSKNCTIVENGRVVVRPLPEAVETGESAD